MHFVPRANVASFVDQQYWESDMPKRCAAAAIVLVSSLLGVGSASATECYPNCDYIHDYGPYDYTYIRPGLYAYPRCDWRGNCLPHYAYIYSPWRGRGQIIIRPHVHVQ